MNLPPLRTLFFEDLSVGMTETLEKTVASSDVVGFAQLTGDRNPIHLSEHSRRGPRSASASPTGSTPRA
jgi:3-hydroxybutyryl-CoA dehydratase